MQRAATSNEVRDHEAEEQRDAPDRGEQQPVEVAALDVESPGRTLSSRRRHRRDDRRAAAGTPCSRCPVCSSKTVCSWPMFTAKKNTGMTSGGDERFLVARHEAQRVARDRAEVREERRRFVGPAMARAAGVTASDRGHRAALLDAPAGQLEEHVVEGGGAQGQVAHMQVRVAASATAIGLIVAAPSATMIVDLAGRAP